MKILELKDLLLIIATFFVGIFTISFLTYLYFAQDLESKEAIMNRNQTGILLLDRENNPFYEFYQAKVKTFIPLDKLPTHTQQAVISAEDKGFYSHTGFSIRAIVGALIADIKLKNFSYGGSTITQQLVKNSLLTTEKSFLRKYQELILALEIERRFNKSEILEMYLNSVYFGEGAFGIEEAAQTYFGKSAQHLDLAESSMLAALLPAPSSYSPYNGNFKMMKQKQNFVLGEMVQQKFINEQEKINAERQALSFKNSNQELNSAGTHFALMVRDELIKKYGEEKVARSGFKVKTSINFDFQKFAENTVSVHVKNLEKNKVSNGAAVVENANTGEILALVGSKDWHDEEFGKVNITTSLRSPGSSFKPIIYAAAFETRRFTPATVLNDNPITYKPGLGIAQELYSPQNYDRKFRGKVTARRSLANSLNIPTIELLHKTGLNQAVDMAKRLGISSIKNPADYGLSFAIGTQEVKLLELTNAFATFANSGSYNNPTLILEITDKNDKTVYKYMPNGKKVIEPEVAFLISSILSDSNSRQEVFGSAINNSRNAAVKTGTGEDFKDALTLGYTPSLAVGVWVGNNNGSPMDQVAGSLGAAPIWKALMEKYLAGKPIEAFSPPENIITSTSCIQTESLIVKQAQAEEPSPQPLTSIQTFTQVKEYFIKGTEPAKKFCPTPSPKPSEAPATTNPPETPKPEDQIPPEKLKSPDQKKPDEQKVEIKIETKND